jgi:hypothetical protein
MRKIFILGLLTTLCFCFGEIEAQSLSTKVERIEIDGKIVKKNYKVFLRSGNEWIEAAKNATGFFIPDELKMNENLSVLVTFGKYKLEFAEVHISNFNTKWTVGVDEKPYSEELISSSQAKTAKRIYYIKFQGGVGLDRTMTVVQKKKIR